jgi:predicted short-subunit dehydrogenase-like oxidoreductase (DUF2520 family)
MGAGRLAQQLMPQLENAECQIIQVYNRTEARAQYLSSKLQNCSYTSDLENISTDADLYFFTLSDDVIGLVADRMAKMDDGKKIFLHCSGVSSLSVLNFKCRGSFYPLQSFSGNHEVNWKEIPILITAEIDELRLKLEHLAHQVSDKVYVVTDEQKSSRHLAAVFANNFTNHLWTLAERICDEHHVSFEILKPLIRETVEKALDIGPSNSQTGPAVRGDQKTIEKHLDMIRNDENLHAIYELMTGSIVKR